LLHIYYLYTDVFGMCDAIRVAMHATLRSAPLRRVSYLQTNTWIPEPNPGTVSVNLSKAVTGNPKP